MTTVPFQMESVFGGQEQKTSDVTLYQIYNDLHIFLTKQIGNVLKNNVIDVILKSN